ncbi:MAG: DEAD/DEAH box helicase [Bowdeniella nasicola]|nr:DEAD/DEAH box helicase [Bowdeniella nasicola]
MTAATTSFDVFSLHRKLIEDYKSFTEGSFTVADPRIRDFVTATTEEGRQWPAPFLQLNPTYAPGDSIAELCDEGVLDARIASLFTANGEPLRLYAHQSEAIRAAHRRESFVLTTGTGSGKSLAYMIPAVNTVLREGSGQGIRAIIVYPMNALANSQLEELDKYLGRSNAHGVTYGLYTGQEDEDERTRMRQTPPDILLTNHVMLEYLLTRPGERDSLIAGANLAYLVLDELHTYRGRQGADIAMLVRRVKQATGASENVVCVGTSATMSSSDDPREAAESVAAVAAKLFGTDVAPAQVIGETLERATVADDDGNHLRESVAAWVERAAGSRADEVELLADPFAAWVESTFGVMHHPVTDRLVRQEPETLVNAAQRLADDTGLDTEDCTAALEAILLAGTQTTNPATGRPLFAFRLHQFISKGASVYVTLESEANREITHDYEVMIAPREDSTRMRRLYPLAFCRVCGKEYLMAQRSADGTFVARSELRTMSEDDGYLFISASDPWPSEPGEVIDRLPESMLNPHTRKPRNPAHVPAALRLDVDGTQADLPQRGSSRETAGVEAAWIPRKLRFCLSCGTHYHQAHLQEFAKVAALNVEGRSSATTALSLGMIRLLREADVPREADKLLAFVDARQDAALQAGHLNDFVLTVLLRRAIFHAARNATERCLPVVDFHRTLVQALNLDPAHYRLNVRDARPERVDRIFARVLEYRAFSELRRGWRVTMPSLEMSGLVAITYAGLAEVVQREDAWRAAPEPLARLTREEREYLVRTLLDEIRRALAIECEELSDGAFEDLKRQSSDALMPLWALDDAARLRPGYAVVGSASGFSRYEETIGLSYRSQFGRWLRRELVPEGETLEENDFDAAMEALLTILTDAGLLTRTHDSGRTKYRINRSILEITVSENPGAPADPVRRTVAIDSPPVVSSYYQHLYQNEDTRLAGTYAREHTAQVAPEDRAERENDFREGRLPLLYCSPTMELGVDISSLNAVLMRNVPPTPANYVQRSGRAGRSGQAALVVTYCASGNAHDAYYFERPGEMVSGRVVPPRLDLTSEALLTSHVHAVWLAETGVGFGATLGDLVDGGGPEWPLKKAIRAELTHPGVAQRTREACEQMLAPLRAELADSSWWSERWLEATIDGAVDSLDRALERWRHLVNVCTSQREEAHALTSDFRLPQAERDGANERYQQAGRQLELLFNSRHNPNAFSDFYPYRYLASEGFLPGYAFPRLPLAAYIPGQRGAGRRNRHGTWIQRPRFLALREFGPHAFIYHEGARYSVERTNLPAGSSTPGQHNSILRDLARCEQCGYDNLVSPDVSVCAYCDAPLASPLKRAMQMQLVVTRRRDRIGTNEEERQRAGFETLTSYRFIGRHPGDPGYLSARLIGGDGYAVDDGGPLTIDYGDSAQIRSINIGLRRRARKDQHGFFLDLDTGQWLSEKKVEARREENPEDARSIPRVIPYVEDHLSTAILTWRQRASDTRAVSVQTALERGIELAFQLEENELDSTLLPNEAGPTRIMFTEAAEGGAGVLRRIATTPDALPRAAREALRLIHVDPDTGEDMGGACTRACYRCLLAFYNQSIHEELDRAQARDVLMRIARGTVAGEDGPADGGSNGPAEGDSGGPDPRPGTDGGENASSRHAPADPEAESRPASEQSGAELLLHYLEEKGLNSPDGTEQAIAGITVDLVYGSQHLALAVGREFSVTEQQVLAFSGWRALSVAGTPEEIVRAHPDVFGSLGA